MTPSLEMPRHPNALRSLQDLTRLENGNETSLSEPFDISATIEEAVQVYRTETERCNIKFTITMEDVPKLVIGDTKKICMAVANLTANAGEPSPIHRYPVPLTGPHSAECVQGCPRVTHEY